MSIPMKIIEEYKKRIQDRITSLRKDFNSKDNIVKTNNISELECYILEDEKKKLMHVKTIY